MSWKLYNNEEVSKDFYEEYGCHISRQYSGFFPHGRANLVKKESEARTHERSSHDCQQSLCLGAQGVNPCGLGAESCGLTNAV